MTDPISLGLGVIGGISSLGGLLGGQAARRRAMEAQQRAIAEVGGLLDQDYQNLVGNNRLNLMAQTGLGGDAIGALGRGLGASLAGAGIYNSSATAGALAQANRDMQSQLAALASQNQFNEKSLLNRNRMQLGQMKFGLANDRLGQANSDLAGARGGLFSFLGSLGQYNLARSGQNQLQNALPRSQGGYGSPSVLAAGAGMKQVPSQRSFIPPLMNKKPFSVDDLFPKIG